ncbi:hypothetical protein Q7P37_011612 [Cladosporium fusiforme]
MAIPTLPEELLQQIFWNLRLRLPPNELQRTENDRRKSTLHSCLLANRCFHRLALPVLYHSIEVLDINAFDRCHAQRPDLLHLTRGLFVFESRYTAINDPITRSDDDPPEIISGVSVVTLFPRLERLIVQSTQKYWHLTQSLLQCVKGGESRLANEAVPLSKLREFVVEPYDDWLQGDRPSGRVSIIQWAEMLSLMPQVTAFSGIIITFSRKFAMPREFPASIPTHFLKRLAFTSSGFDTHRLGHIISASPALEHLDIEINKDSVGQVEWDIFDKMLSPLCMSLRSLKLNVKEARLGASAAEHPSLIDLRSFSGLRTLTLPIEGILTEPQEYVVPDPDHEDGYSQHATAYADDDEILSEFDSEDEFIETHKLCEGVNTPTIPITHILPSSIRRLRIIDDWNLWADTVRLDMQLRDLMTLPEFGELRFIAVRRPLSFTKHVRVEGWQIDESDPFWKVLRRKSRFLI